MLEPQNYRLLAPPQRRELRERYIVEQKGNCHHCNCPVREAPPKSSTSLKVDWSLFPPNFLKHPIHLHHDHKTNMTIGAVHAYCNAVLWFYHGE